MYEGSIIVKVHANTCDMKEEDFRGFLFDGLIFGFKFALHRFPPTNATDGPTAGKHASLPSARSHQEGQKVDGSDGGWVVGRRQHVVPSGPQRPVEWKRPSSDRQKRGAKTRLVHFDRVLIAFSDGASAAWLIPYLINRGGLIAIGVPQSKSVLTLFGFLVIKVTYIHSAIFISYEGINTFVPFTFIRRLPSYEGM